MNTSHNKIGSKFIKISKRKPYHNFDLTCLKKCADGFVIWRDTFANLLSSTYDYHRVHKKIVEKIKKAKYWNAIPRSRKLSVGNNELYPHDVVILEHTFSKDIDHNRTDEHVEQRGGIDQFIPICTALNNLNDLSSREDESIASTSSSTSSLDSEEHLVVCVHGLEGTPRDLEYFVKYLKRANKTTKYKFLHSQCNVENTWLDINLMGRNLLEEVILTVKAMSNVPSKISFLGHSMGSLIIRSMFNCEEVTTIAPFLHTFLSLNSPHLGVSYCPTQTSVGMKLLKWYYDSESMRQLTLKDTLKIRDSFIYKLSQNDAFPSFQNVLLVGNYLDLFVPGHTALLEHCTASKKDKSAMGSAYNEMIDIIHDSLMNSERDTNLVKYIITHIADEGITVDRLLGRDGHIAICNDRYMMEKLIKHSAGKFFE